MIILIGSQKGGCGKSTTAMNIATELAINGADVVLVDADRQSTAANWINDRLEKNQQPKIHLVQRYDNIKETLQDLDGRYDYVIVDAAGRDSRELRSGVLAAHVLIIPFKPSQADLDTLPKIQEIIIQAQDLNPALKVYGLLTMSPTNPSIQEKQEAGQVFKNYPEIGLLNAFLSERKVYRDALSEGLGVVEMDNAKAKHEIQELVKEILK